MNIIFKNLSAAVATLAAFAGSAFAQLQTFETQSEYQGSVFTFNAPGSVLGETFANVSAVKSMTYNFFAGSGNGGVSTASSLTAVFGEWNGSAFVSGTTVSFGTISIPASDSGSWSTLTNGFGSFNTFEYALDLTTVNSGLINPTFGYLTDFTKTYALMLTNVSGSNLGLGLTNTNAFAFGATNLGFNDWAFAQIVVAPGDQQLVPVPESSTVALAATGALVAGLVGFRIRQRRRAAATLPVAA
jgi:hypothetical protein